MRCSASSRSPIFLCLTSDCRRRRVLHLDPGIMAAANIAGAEALRHDPLASQLAGSGEYLGSPAVNVLAQLQPGCTSAAHKNPELTLSLLNWVCPEVFP